MNKTRLVWSTLFVVMVLVGCTLPTPIDVTPVPDSSVNPHIVISASAATIQVGDTVTITGVPVGIGLPYYNLYLDDQAIARVTYSGEARPEGGTNPVLEFVSATGAMRQAQFVLRATSAGTVTARINATGEIHKPEGATWAGGGSDPLTITVSP
ncbi:MAG: hypothetical protein KKA73_26750 [Chloroflexi bacterium]|nr:hypothetical protein [Chloroflexota bacterium]MBU1751300.1 hypothetical protein [Chloroflexota bacterium]